MRILAREVCFKCIYATMFGSGEDAFNTVCEDNGLNEENDISFSKQLFDLWQTNKTEIEELVKSSLTGYELDRVYKVDLALIEMALAEIYFYKETPKAVVINEVISLAKKYSTDKSYSFINGLFKSIEEGRNG